MSLQQEWNVFQCVTSSFGPLFDSMEAALRGEFILYLLGGRREEIMNPSESGSPGV